MKSHRFLTYVFLLLLAAGSLAMMAPNSGFGHDSNLSGSGYSSNINHSQVNSLLSVPPNHNGKPPNSPKKPNKISRTVDKIIEMIISLFFAVSGLYVCFYGFKTFRLTMVILGFYVSYHLLLFLAVEAEIFQEDNLGHQIGLFFLSLTLGFIISVLCYVLDKVNFLIFGAAVSCMLGLFTLEFALDIRIADDRHLLYLILGATFLVTSALAFFVLDHFIIWGFGFVGSVSVLVNLGVIFGKIVPFENRSPVDKPAGDLFKQFAIIGLLIWMSGVACQYWLRRRLIRKWQDDGEEINPRGTFLEDRF